MLMIFIKGLPWYIVSTLKTTLKSMLRYMSENDMQRLRKNNMSDNETTVDAYNSRQS